MIRNPVKFTLPNGETVDLFYIGALAEALGRSSQTVRQWEISGILPDPMFRDKNNRRLYTQEQIDVIVECAEKAKISRGRPINSSTFSTNCYKRLEELKRKYRGIK